MQRGFNFAPELVGKKVEVKGRSFTLGGIMPNDFEFPLPLFNMQGGQFTERVDIWKPVAFSEMERKSRGSRDYAIVARLNPGVTPQQAQSELNGIIAHWKQQYPDNYGSDANF